MDNTLSGRILRLIVTCNYTSGDPPAVNGCLLFKAVGAVTCECVVIQTWHVVQIHYNYQLSKAQRKFD